MALTNLPYPAMDFVPLDILTADELDHMVANIEAINNSTFAPRYQTAKNATATNTSSSYPTMASFVVPVAGTYLVLAGSTINATNADYYIGRIVVGTSVQQTNQIYITAGYFGVLALSAVVTVTANQTLYYKVGSNGANGKSSDNYLHAVRIA